MYSKMSLRAGGGNSSSATYRAGSMKFDFMLPSVMFFAQKTKDVPLLQRCVNRPFIVRITFANGCQKRTQVKQLLLQPLEDQLVDRLSESESIYAWPIVIVALRSRGHKSRLVSWSYVVLDSSKTSRRHKVVLGQSHSEWLSHQPRASCGKGVHHHHHYHYHHHHHHHHHHPHDS